MSSLIVCVSGPEGVGKDTLIRELLKHFPWLAVGFKATTRSRRDDDYDVNLGRDKYDYLSEQEFMARRTTGEIVEHSQNANGCYYGSYVDPKTDGVEIRDLDVNGALQLYAKSKLEYGFPEVCLVGILPPTQVGISSAVMRDIFLRTLAEGGVDSDLAFGPAVVLGEMLNSLNARLLARGDSDLLRTQKLDRAQWEIPEIIRVWPNVIVNDDLQEATAALCGVVEEAMGIAVEDRRFAAWSGAPLP
jgi:guanylate kinase